MLASIIVLSACLKPLSIALIIDLPDLNSSRILSNISTLASTAIPIVKAIPAIPGKVKVAPITPRHAKIVIIFRSSAKLEIRPNTLPYIKNI